MIAAAQQTLTPTVVCGQVMVPIMPALVLAGVLLITGAVWGYIERDRDWRPRALSTPEDIAQLVPIDAIRPHGRPFDWGKDVAPSVLKAPPW